MIVADAAVVRLPQCAGGAVAPAVRVEPLAVVSPHPDPRVAVARDELRPVIAIEIDGEHLLERHTAANQLGRVGGRQPDANDRRRAAVVDQELVVLAIAVEVDRDGSFSRGGGMREEADTRARHPEHLAQRQCEVAHVNYR